MSTTFALDHHSITAVMLRPLLGSSVSVHTAKRRIRGTLLSCVKGTAWLVVDDTDVVVKLDDIVAVREMPPSSATASKQKPKRPEYQVVIGTPGG